MTVQEVMNNGNKVELLVYTSHEEEEKYWVIKGLSRVFCVPYDSIFYNGIEMSGKDFTDEYDDGLRKKEM